MNEEKVFRPAEPGGHNLIFNDLSSISVSNFITGIPAVDWSINQAMHGATFNPHFDGKHSCLDAPYIPSLNKPFVVVALFESDETLEEERAAWFALGKQSLAQAFGDDEPDYSDDIGRRPPE